MRNKLIKKLLSILFAIAFWITFWKAASLLISENLKLFLPSPFSVISAFINLVQESQFWKAVILTLIRIFGGFVFGVTAGIIFGILTSHIRVFDIVISPAMRIIRAVPVVSFIILAYLFINVNYLPIFICFLMVMPLVWQTVHDELEGFDKNQSEMASVFGIVGFKRLIYVELTSVWNKVLSAMINGIGLAWKSGVATEVLCTPAISLGRNLYRAKGNINYDEVYAVTLTVVILSITIENIIKLCYTHNKRQEKSHD